MGATINSPQVPTTTAPGGSFGACDDIAEITAILAAGARARAVADAFAANGLAAILMDGAGRVLHVGALAESLFGDSLRLESRHLVGRDEQANQAIETALNAVLGGAQSRGRDAPVVPVRADGSLVMTAVAYRETSPVQLLQAIVLIATDEPTLRARLKTLDL